MWSERLPQMVYTHTRLREKPMSHIAGVFYFLIAHTCLCARMNLPWLLVNPSICYFSFNVFFGFHSLFRPDVFQRLVHLQNFQNQFLPNALRQFFREISAPKSRGEHLSNMIDGFSDRFCSCNPKLGLSKGTNLHFNHKGKVSIHVWK